jgi:hypothetical protein
MDVFKGSPGMQLAVYRTTVSEVKTVAAGRDVGFFQIPDVHANKIIGGPFNRSGLSLGYGHSAERNSGDGSVSTGAFP